MDADIRAVADRISRETGLPIAINLVSSYPAQPFHADCVDAVARAAKALGYSHMPVVSGAGHDAVYMARLAPAGMVFIPCKDGISHNEIEDATPADITAGDRKSTRLNSSHLVISYAVFCLKKKNQQPLHTNL